MRVMIKKFPDITPYSLVEKLFIESFILLFTVEHLT